MTKKEHFQKIAISDVWRHARMDRGVRGRIQKLKESYSKGDWFSAGRLKNRTTEQLDNITRNTKGGVFTDTGQHAAELKRRIKAIKYKDYNNDKPAKKFIKNTKSHGTKFFHGGGSRNNDSGEKPRKPGI